MLKKINLLFVVFLLVMSQVSVAQVDLKGLRAKPDTNIVEKPQAPVTNLQEVMVPIPKLDLEVNYWKHWTKFGVNMNQASFSENWSAGGVNSIAIGLLGWHKSEYNKNNFQYVTEIDLRYGKIRNKDQLAKKNNDRIFWDHKIAHKLSQNWAIYFSVTFESQFDAGYKYGKDSETNDEIITDTISRFMAPGYFTESFGLEYKPDNTFSLRLGTGTARQTLVLDDRISQKANEKDRFGVDQGARFRNDLAFQITANLDRNLSKNLNIKARYNMFADYKELSDPDHRLDAVLTAKVTNLVNVSLTGIMVYNSDEDVKVQYSQALALGLTYTLPR
ncbi:DUF3078 domain-containing protein [Sphingobacterium phlebotomi]|uniref:DUF3078 domain-containing protein n=1 Tax=Sphingobacterium phlebotomi TaxID=2605433 RepID=A0A5D4H845_9SPHI|nr:DUF3078 domain-containing protein [Sphingobacterium phlebotomi]TYR37271.1 DUF3078 domain-containing protein [Sphingobacterium phlebotomi]